MLFLAFGVIGCATSQPVAPRPHIAVDPRLFTIPTDSQAITAEACDVPSFRVNGGSPDLVPGSGLTMAEYVSRVFLTTCEAGVMPASRTPILVQIQVVGDIPVSITVDDGRGPRVFTNANMPSGRPGVVPQGFRPDRASFLLKSVFDWFGQTTTGMPGTARGLFDLFCDDSPMMIPEMPDPAEGDGPVFMLVNLDTIFGTAFHSTSRVEWAYAPPKWAGDGISWSNTRGGSTGLVRFDEEGVYRVQSVFLVQDASNGPGECENAYDLSASGLNEIERAGLQARLAASDQEMARSNPDRRGNLCSHYRATSHPTRFEGSISGGLGGFRDHASFSLFMQIKNGEAPDEHIQMTTSMFWGPRDVSWNTCNRAVRRRISDGR